MNSAERMCDPASYCASQAPQTWHRITVFLACMIGGVHAVRIFNPRDQGCRSYHPDAYHPDWACNAQCASLRSKRSHSQDLAIWNEHGRAALGRYRSDNETSCPWIRFNYRCFGVKNERYLSALPPLDRQQLQCPNHVHAILYGPSFLHQIFEAFLCRNSLSALYSFGNHSAVRHGTSRATAVIENRALLCNAGKEQLHLRSTHRSLANSRPCDPHVDEATNTIVQASFANGAQMLGIFNSGTLQDSTDPAKMLGKLQNFLNSLSGFTHAVVMAPHPACFFPSTRADDKCFVNMSDPSSNRFSDGVLQQVVALFQKFIPRVLVVDSWTDAGSSAYLKTGTLKLANSMASHYSNADKCGAPTSDGHQCQPGAVEIGAKELLKQLLI